MPWTVWNDYGKLAEGLDEEGAKEMVDTHYSEDSGIYAEDDDSAESYEGPSYD